MKVYLDLVFILNIAFDFLLLLSVNILLKKNASYKRIILGSLVGGCSIFFLFLPLSNLSLFFFKFLISMAMIYTTFSFSNIKTFFQNIFYLYLLSIILGGFLTYLKTEFSYRHQGILFFEHGTTITYLFLFIASPIILAIYIKEQKNYKAKISKRYVADLYIGKKKYPFTAFLDTGNHLKDPYRKRPVILVSTNKIRPPDEKVFLVPYHTANIDGLLRCMVADKLIINQTFEVKHPVIGIVQDDLGVEGVNMILNNETLGGFYD